MIESTPYAAGMDISDRDMKVCVFGPGGSLHEEIRVSVERSLLERYLKRLVVLDPVVALETGTHSNWIHDLLLELGFTKIIVADARMLKMISTSNKKTDELDARILARFAQSCPELLHPVKPRGEQARQDRRLLSARQVSVESRTKLVSFVRGIVKSTGARLPQCQPENFSALAKELPESLVEILTPVMDVIAKLNESIQVHDELIVKRCADTPVTDRLRQVSGVGPVTSLAFAATIEDPMRFTKNRSVGSFIGLRPKVDKSGMIDKQLRITKAGDKYLRQLLVTSAHTIMRKNSPMTDLKRWGLSIAASGGKKGKRRAAVAVARKLGVLLLALWKSGADYQPLRQRKPTAQASGTTKVVVGNPKRVRESKKASAR